MILLQATMDSAEKLHKNSSEWEETQLAIWSLIPEPLVKPKLLPHPHFLSRANTTSVNLQLTSLAFLKSMRVFQAMVSLGFGIG